MCRVSSICLLLGVPSKKDEMSTSRSSVRELYIWLGYDQNRTRLDNCFLFLQYLAPPGLNTRETCKNGALSIFFAGLFFGVFSIWLNSALPIYFFLVCLLGIIAYAYARPNKPPSSRSASVGSFISSTGSSAVSNVRLLPNSGSDRKEMAVNAYLSCIEGTETPPLLISSV